MIKRELKNAGIKPLEQLSVQEKANIAEKIAIELARLNINYNSILERIFSVQMYRAKIRNNSEQAIYFYKNKTIYFNQNLQLENLNNEIIHTCIQYLQDQRKIKNTAGLCTFKQYKIKGYALNEVGINYIANKILNQKDESKMGILLKQIILITGEEAFLDSVLNTNDKFKEKFIEEIGSKELYSKVKNTFDTILNLEQIIDRLNFEGRESKIPQKYLSKINIHKHTISTAFSKIQWEIYSKYFSKKIELIQNQEDAKIYKNELFNYNQLLEISEEKLKYTNFATEKLNKIKLKINHNSSMVLVENGYIHKIIRTIKRIIFKSKQCEASKE